jgi:hypothetical protein
MNEEEFLNALKVHGFKWEINHWFNHVEKRTRHMLRSVLIESHEFDGTKATSINYFCPITAVCYGTTARIYQGSYYQEAANLLGLDEDLRDRIFDAADDVVGCDQRLRNRLFEICKPERVTYAASDPKDS